MAYLFGVAAVLWRPHPVCDPTLSSPHLWQLRYKGGWDTDTSGLCPAAARRVDPAQFTKREGLYIQLKGEDDFHGTSTGPSAGEGTRHWHQQACSEVR